MYADDIILSIYIGHLLSVW